MRKPTVKNKYNLTIRKAKNLKIDRSKVNDLYGFWRNDIVKAWCLSGGVGRSPLGGSMSSFWIGIYDDESKKVSIKLDAYEGMFNYNISKFYQLEDIETEVDLGIQELLLSKLNELIDNGILKL